MKAIITVGISGSGKTTWAEDFCNHNLRPGDQPKWVNSNRDDIRFTKIIQERDWSKYKFNGVNEQLVTETQHADWASAAMLGYNLVVSDTHLSAKARNNTSNKLKKLGYEVEFKDFPITLEEAWRRDSLRPNGVGKAVLYKQWKDWLVYTERRIYCPDIELPKAIMFDIDGTVAHMSGRSPFEWDKVGEDRVDKHVRLMLKAYRAAGYKLIAMSGRDGSCQELTKRWFYVHDIPWDWLVMRDAGDMRKDSIIKEELFWKSVAPRFNVEAVFDDRPVVCRMWHDIGLKVFACADQNEEF